MTGYKSKKAAARDKLAPNNETLVKRLRDTASRGVSVWGDLMLEAADALEQPSQRPWVGLTAEEQSALVLKYGDTPVALCLETERTLKEKNI